MSQSSRSRAKPGVDIQLFLAGMTVAFVFLGALTVESSPWVGALMFACAAGMGGVFVWANWPTRPDQ